MTDELLPALPDHPSGKGACWSIEETRVIRAYAREAIRLALGEPVAWQTLGIYGWVAISRAEFDALQAHGLGEQRKLYAPPAGEVA